VAVALNEAVVAVEQDATWLVLAESDAAGMAEQSLQAALSALSALSAQAAQARKPDRFA